MTHADTKVAKGQKKPHSKSKAGCFHCKQRKVKVSDWGYVVRMLADTRHLVR
jgi:hypothetical protein